MAKRSIATVFTEATIIGLMSVGIYYILKKFNVNTILALFLVGFLMHLFFEFSPFGNVNEMWCRQTFP
ncbi:hypothetical protein [Dishui Lake phycodnavirus 4]|nr:hypothetical protein [Dishui Lake phycodnavirus 4]